MNQSGALSASGVGQMDEDDGFDMNVEDWDIGVDIGIGINDIIGSNDQNPLTRVS